MKRSSSKKLSQNSLRSSPSREGEVVDVPIKLVKSRSRSNKDDGEVDDSYRSFDDSISALSAHTLDEMAMRYPKPIYTTLRGPEGSSRPRNGDQLLPPPPAERISDSESSNESEDLPDDCKPTQDVENDIPAVSKMDTAPTYKLMENDPFLKKGLPRKSYRASQQAATSKSSGRKSRREVKRTLEVEPQMAEI
jgi:acyl-homoserine lactone acylase PvdQ